MIEVGSGVEPRSIGAADPLGPQVRDSRRIYGQPYTGPHLEVDESQTMKA